MAHVPEKNGKSVAVAKQSADEKKPKETTMKEELVQPPPPDGGWGWIVVFASFMVHIMTDGVTYSYGVFQKEFTKYFTGSTEQAISWIASLLVGVTYCSGPISSFLVNKFGCRTVTVLGTIIASGCLLASAWADSITVLYFTAGIGTGFGFGLIYLPAIVSVTIYFEKYRSLATGIAVCGSGFGTVAFAPMIKFLINYFEGYSGAMMILAGIVLTCIIFGLMFKPLDPVKSSECIPLQDVKSNGTTNFPASEGNKGLDRRLSVSHVPPKKYSNVSVKTTDNTSNNIRLALSQPILVTKDGNQAGEPFPRTSCGSGIMNRSDVFLRSSIHNIRKRSESLANSEENVRFRLSLRSLPNAGHRVPIEGPECQDDSDQTNIIMRMLRFSLLRDPIFIIFTVSNFCTSLGFNVPYNFLISLAEQSGIDEDTGTTLISVIGFANTVGRIVLGYLSDKPWVNRLLVYNLCLTFCGLSTAFCTICNSFITFAICSSVFGFTAGAYVGLTSVCLVDLVGLEHLTNAFGLVLLSQGAASFIGPPIAGALKDTFETYNPSFYFAGLAIAISGLMLFVIPPIQKHMLKSKEQLQRIDTVA